MEHDTEHLAGAYDYYDDETSYSKNSFLSVRSGKSNLSRQSPRSGNTSIHSSYSH